MSFSGAVTRCYVFTVAGRTANIGLEEYLTGWQQWALQTLGIVMPTMRFFVANAVLVVVALVFARVGWRRPRFSLVIPAATLVNAIFFHILPTIVQSHASPGVYTATLLYALLLLGVVGCAARRCTWADNRRSDGRGYAHDGGSRFGCEMAG
jgi:Protein of unknown function with HXXEE motif